MNKIILMTLLAIFSLRAEARSIKTIEKTAFLGDGYNSITEEFAESCFKGEVRYPGNSHGVLEQRTTLSTDEMMSALNIKVGAKISLEVISAEGAVDFLASINDKDLSMSTHLRNPIKGDSAVLHELSLTDRGKQILAQSTNEVNPSQYFYKYCGDEVVNKIDLGGELTVTVNFNFSNRDVITTFKATANIDLIDIIQANASTDVDYKKFDNDLSIKVTAHQKGGDVAQLGRIFQGSNGANSNLISCKISNLQPCKDAFNAVTNYVTNNEYGFVTQLKNLSYNPAQPNGAAFLKYHTVKVSQLAIPELAVLDPQSLVAIEVQNARQDLLRKYISVSKDLSKANYLVYDGIALDSVQFTKITKIIRTLESNRELVKNAVKICQVNIQGCLEAVNGLRLAHYNPGDLEKKFTFFDYCQFPQVTNSSALTVSRIIKSLDIPNTELRKNCKYIFENIIPTISRLDLSSGKVGANPIIDLSPLRSLKKLKILDISNNAIFSLLPLAELSELNTLIAKNNRISSLWPIKDLNKLKAIDVSGNAYISDFEHVINMPHLERLWAYNSDDELLDDIRDEIPATNLILTQKDLCQMENHWAYSLNKVSKSDYRRALEVGLVPDYNNVNDPDNSSISGWIFCEFGHKLITPRDEWKRQLPVNGLSL